MKPYHQVKKLEVRGDKLFLEVDGKSLEVNLKQISPAFRNANSGQLQKFELSPSGYGIHWPLIDEDVSIDEYVVMPNHVHGIIHINQINQNKPRSQTRNLVTPSFNYNTIVRAQDSAPLQIKPRLGKIIGGYKIGVTKWVRKNTNLHTIWQRSFFDQVVRNDIQLERIRTYIRNNQSSHDSPQTNVSFY